jgi:hypothetical protein
MYLKTNHNRCLLIAFLLLIMLPLAGSCQKVTISDKPYKPHFPFTGYLYFTSSYCGGARPTQEILKQHATPKILPNTTLHLHEVSDTSKTNYTIVTDKDGKFSSCMPPGTYNVYMTDKYDAKALPDFDPECKAWLEQSLTQIEIRDNIPANTNIDLKLFFHCNPCMVPQT